MIRAGLSVKSAPMKRLPPFVALAASVLFTAGLLTGCTGPTYLPDGGRVRQTCQNVKTNIAVKVQDLKGEAIADATVTAKNQASGEEVVSVTGGDGRTNALTDDLGNGQIFITATAGALKTRQAFVIQITCGECDCSATPANAVLTLE